MEILTLNAWGNYGPVERQAVLLSALDHRPVDILCLQEVPSEEFLKRIGLGIHLYSSESGLAILSSFPAAEKERLTYQTVSPLESNRREALFARFQIQSQSLWVATTHLSWKAEDENSRVLQVQELLNRWKTLEGPTLLTGDFNAVPGTPSVSQIHQVGFVDLFEKHHRLDPGITWDNRNPFIQSHSVQFPDRRIDYLFADPKALGQLTLKRCEVILNVPTAEGVYPSDHYGVLASFEIQ